MKHLSATPAPPSDEATRHPARRSTWSSCARSPRTRPRGTRARRRWTPTSSASPAGSGSRARPRTRRRRCSRGASFPDAAATAVVPSAAATPVAGRAAGPPDRATTSTTTSRARRRPSGPGCSRCLLVAGAAIAGVYVYEKIQDQLDQAQPVGVPYVVGIKQANAADRADLAKPGLARTSSAPPSRRCSRGYVYLAGSEAGRPRRQGQLRPISGSPPGSRRSIVPNLVGETVDRCGRQAHRPQPRRRRPRDRRRASRRTP